MALVGAASLFSAAASAQNEIVSENQLPGSPASEWDVSGAGDPTIQGFATDVSVDQGGTITFKILTRCNRLPGGHLPPGILQRDGRAPGGVGGAFGDAAPDTTVVHLGRSNGAPGLRDMGRLGVVGRAVKCDLRRLHRQARAGGSGGRACQSHRLRGARRRRSVGSPLPGLGDHVAGLQLVRREQPVRRLGELAVGPAGAQRSASTGRTTRVPEHPKTGSSTPPTP